VRRKLAIFILLCQYLAPGSRDVGAAEKKATVFGSPTANMRAGAGIDQPLKLTLKEGDQVTVEKLDGEWYQVTTSDGQTGYVHKNLLKLVDESAAQQTAPAQKSVAADIKEAAKIGAVETPSAQSASVPAVVANESPKPPTPPAPTPKAAVPTARPTRAEAPKAADSKSPSGLQMLEGHETELKIGFLIAGIAFLLGWLCGGSYYLRRERKSWRKLRL